MKLTTNGIEIDKTNELIQEYTKRCTFRTTPNYITGKIVVIKAFKCSRNHVYVPKFTECKEPVENTLETIAIDNCKDSSIVLRPNQVEIYNAITEKINTINGCVLSVPCGVGKTVLGIKLISDLKVKTLIIVHKDFLMKQWKESIEQFVPDIKVGIIKQKDVDTDSPIVIASLQTLMNNVELTKKLKFSLLIVDECHHMASKEFSKVLLNLKTSKYTLGLSATPEREDHCENLFYSFLGPLVRYDTSSENIKPIVLHPIYTVCQGFNILTKTVMGKCTLDIVGMVSALANNKRRTGLIFSLLKGMKNENRQIVVLSERIQLLDNLAELLEQNKMAFSKCYNGKQEYLPMGNGILLASYSMASEGLNILDLDTLILATPLASRTKLVQSIGRIQRGDTKNEKTIIDIIDPILTNQFKKRSKIYAEFTNIRTEFDTIVDIDNKTINIKNKLLPMYKPVDTQCLF